MTDVAGQSDDGNKAATNIERTYLNDGVKAAADALRKDFLSSSTDPRGKIKLEEELSKLDKDDPTKHVLGHIAAEWAEAHADGGLTQDKLLKIKSDTKSPQFDSRMADILGKQFSDIAHGGWQLWRDGGIDKSDAQNRSELFETNRQKAAGSKITSDALMADGGKLFNTLADSKGAIDLGPLNDKLALDAKAKKEGKPGIFTEQEAKTVKYLADNWFKQGIHHLKNFDDYYPSFSEFSAGTPGPLFSKITKDSLNAAVARDGFADLQMRDPSGVEVASTTGLVSQRALLDKNYPDLASADPTIKSPVASGDQTAALDDPSKRQLGAKAPVLADASGDPAAQKTEPDAKALADAEAKRIADAKALSDAAEVKRTTEEKALADAAEAKRTADAKALADQAEAKRVADAKALADAAEAKRIADAKALADNPATQKTEPDAKALAEAEAKRVQDEKALADAAEAKRLAEAKPTQDPAETQRLADEAEAKRVADAKALADADAQRQADAAKVQPSEPVTRSIGPRPSNKESEETPGPVPAPVIEAGKGPIEDPGLKAPVPQPDQGRVGDPPAADANPEQKLDAAGKPVELAKPGKDRFAYSGDRHGTGDPAIVDPARPDPDKDRLAFSGDRHKTGDPTKAELAKGDLGKGDPAKADPADTSKDKVIIKKGMGYWDAAAQMLGYTNDKMTLKEQRHHVNKDLTGADRAKIYQLMEQMRKANNDDFRSSKLVINQELRRPK